MLSSGILDFAIGLVFTFLAVSLAAGAATEAVASFLKTRSSTLLQGVKDLLNDPDFNGLALQLYQNGLINPRGNGAADTASSTKTDPAYIDPNHFAAALLDIIKGLPDPPPPDPNAPTPPDPDPDRDPAPAPAPNPLAPPAVDQINRQIAKVPGDSSGQLRKMLYGVVERAEGDEKNIRDELSTWFDNSMDRVSGVYKRQAQLWSFIFAFAIAAILNVSTIEVAKSLWKQPIDTKAIGSVTDQTKLADYLTTLDTLPIGWSMQVFPSDSGNLSTSTGRWVLWIFLHIAGWAITAFATLFGAPFWFDLLQQFVRLKGSGPSPAEKNAQTAASG